MFVRGHWVLGHLPGQDPYSPFLTRQPAVGRVMVVPNFFHFTTMKATGHLGTCNALEMVLYSWPDLYLYLIIEIYGELWDLIHTGVCFSTFAIHII